MPERSGVRTGSKSCSHKAGARFWTAALLVFALLIYAGTRWIPPRSPPRPPAPKPVEVTGVVVPLKFVEGTPLDLNQATQEQLMALPGIGPVLAQRIVAWREEHGPFASLDELLEVPGIGKELLAALRPLVKVEPP